MFKKSVGAAVAAIALFAAPASAAINLVTNGSFELGVAFSTNFRTINAVNSTDITGWTVSSGNIDLINTYWQHSDGARSIDLNGTTVGVLSQTINGLVAGQTYTVSFDLAGNPDGGQPKVKTLNASIGSTVFSTSFDTTGQSRSNMGWENRTFTFLSTGTSATLAFASTSNQPCCFGPALDNVSVSAVPEPSTWAMMLIGFAGLGYAAHRRRKAVAA